MQTGRFFSFSSYSWALALWTWLVQYIHRNALTSIVKEA